ncbi:similar to Saccharomyces cerevisiae YLR272C YCS4 Subunit of the condensin complex [Maudiozyma saulgeensis]|uniref:Condensin complex subunit 1 n=1 Tax=Maudiozyma saulgeensis TaxID=1789683 RepID=A0A1X7R748_9SACH|nr:similar to Saccharomyces cerevisiae YLR272C YCS4 Subunit of the condensin complex [Kazachstania saulgeensis]
MTDFVLSEYLSKFQTSDKTSFSPVENASRELNVVIDKLAVSPEQIDTEEETLESLIDLCQGFPHLTDKLQIQLSYLISSSCKILSNDIQNILTGTSNFNDTMELIPEWKRHLEEYGYLIHTLLFFLKEDIHKTASRSANLNRGRKVPGGNVETQVVEKFKSSCNQILQLCETIVAILNINFNRIFQTTVENDLFIGLFTRPLFSLVEVEAVIKVPALNHSITSIIALSVRNHGQSSSAQNAILTNLTYFSHLSNFTADLLTVVSSEFNYPQLTEDILKDISNRVFNAKDSTGPKSISGFLIKLSSLLPVVMLRQMSSLIKLLNNSSITLRCSIVEACGNIVINLAKDGESFVHYKQQIGVLIELLEERFQDSNPYVRTKAIQGCLRIIDLNVKLNEKRASITMLAVRSLQDRSSLVRRNATKLLSKLLLKHPFNLIHGSQLRLSDWKMYLSVAEETLGKLLGEVAPTDSIVGDSETIHGTDDVSRIEEEATDVNGINGNAILKARLMVSYYKDAIEFIESLHSSIDLISDLLFSRNRNEVLEAMDFLVLCDAYDLEPSEHGIKKMLHLVWVKGTNDEGTSISTHLIYCYKQLFLTAPDGVTAKERSGYIAKNLIDLTVDASVADLASLEKLLGMMYQDNLIDENIIRVLWAIYNSTLKDDVANRFTKDQLHGSIIVLSMLALENYEIITKGLDSLLNIGLGDIGSKDLILCKYSCIALERMVPKKETTIQSMISKAQEEVAVKKLYKKVVNNTKDLAFYPMCEQAINALFTISSKPDIVGSELIREKTMMTFGKPESGEDSMMVDTDSRVVSLSQLLFIVGQIAIKTLVYLEKCEAEFKKRKIQAEIQKGKEKDNQQNDASNTTTDSISKDKELEMIGDTNEDDFTDAIQFIKETELLYGENSLFKKFCPIIEEIVSNSTRFNDVMLQRTATLCMEKLMCISSKYCEKSLPLLITVMEKSPDPIVRSNAVLGLGDVAVCFNNLVDENTDYLYRRLHDENLMVQRTCLMTVTFLILAGQVKVKGQLAEMAKCLENPDQGISDMCRLFFTELATKDNAIYNGFIDIFSNLSSDKMLKQDGFKKIIKFLLSFVEKERHQKQLCDKLCSRLKKCTTQEQWDDVEFVLNNISFKNEKITALLGEGFKLVSARE